MTGRDSELLKSDGTFLFTILCASTRSVKAPYLCLYLLWRHLDIYWVKLVYGEQNRLSTLTFRGIC